MIVGTEYLGEISLNPSAAKLIIALSQLKGVGPSKIVSFAKRYGYDYSSCLENSMNFFGISKEDLDNNLKTAETVIKINKDAGISVACLLDDCFPKHLCECNNPVSLLYYIGNIDLLKSKTVTVIGTRKPDQSFKDKGRLLVKKLAEMHYTIVSGLAIGCDTLAHESALEFNTPTIAVLPSPCDDIYPKTNRKLAEDIIINGGLLITEYGSGTPFSKFHLIERDRIQSILSSMIIVIQATDDGGSMIAVSRSIKDGKNVMAIKGNNLKLVDHYVDPELESDIAEIDCSPHMYKQQSTLDNLF